MFVIMAGLLFVVAAISLATSTRTVVLAPEPNGEIIEWRALRFFDLPDGSVRAIDTLTGNIVSQIPSGEGSFLRGALRSLVRARSARDLNVQSAFELTLYADGRLILQDPETREAIDLVAFGPTNYHAFRQLLPDATRSQ
jgi:putative photosynthetic complex assembly protein